MNLPRAFSFCFSATLRRADNGAYASIINYFSGDVIFRFFDLTSLKRKRKWYKNFLKEKLAITRELLIRQQSRSPFMVSGWKREYVLQVHKLGGIMMGVTRDGYYIMINRSSLSDQGNKGSASWRVDATAIAANTIERIHASDRTCIAV